MAVAAAEPLDPVEDATLEELALIALAELLVARLEDVLVAVELKAVEERLELAKLLAPAEQARTNSHACVQ